VQDNLSGTLGWTAIEWRSLWAGDAGRVALNVLAKLLGLVITALAISMGAPFWFDVINKVANLRATLKPYWTKPESTAKRPPAAQASQSVSLTVSQPPAEAQAQIL